MKIDIRFRHMERSEPLEEFVTAKLTRVLENVLHRQEAHIQVWLISELNLANRGTGWFICEINTRYPPRKDFFVRKEASDMYVAIQDAVDATRILIDEAGKKESHQRKQSQPVSSLPPAEPGDQP